MELYLRRCLADTFVFYYKAHAAHWNVVGPDFPQYHAYLDSLNSELFGAVDPIAEHIRAAGAMAPESLIALLAETSVEEFAVAADSADPKAIFNALLRANQRTIDSLTIAFGKAAEVNDQGLCNFLGERLDIHAKHGWMLRSILGSK